jgi:hypothetical protein
VGKTLIPQILQNPQSFPAFTREFPINPVYIPVHFRSALSSAKAGWTSGETQK